MVAVALGASRDVVLALTLVVDGRGVAGPASNHHLQSSRSRAPVPSVND